MANSHRNSNGFVQIPSWNRDMPLDATTLWKMMRKHQLEVTARLFNKELNVNDQISDSMETILLRNVPREEFLKLIKDIEMWPMFVPKSDAEQDVGYILCTEPPCTATESLCEYLTDTIQKEYQRCDCKWFSSYKVCIETLHEVTWLDGRIKTPGAILLTNGLRAGAYMVINVSYFISLEKFRNQIFDWIHFTNDVGICIGVKIFPKDSSGFRKMLLLYADRSGMKQEIEFGVAERPEALRISILGHSAFCNRDATDPYPNITVNLRTFRDIILTSFKHTP